jgi:hypothetical protein
VKVELAQFATQQSSQAAELAPISSEMAADVSAEMSWAGLSFGNHFLPYGLPVIVFKISKSIFSGPRNRFFDTLINESVFLNP